MVRKPKRIPQFKLPDGERGEFLFTPKISEETNTHIKDLEPMVIDRGEELGIDMYINIDICSKGVNVKFGPASDLDLSEMEEYIQETHSEDSHK